MFDFAWSELALIAVVALVVIGPKDLPRVMRTVGIWVRKARAIAQEFQGSLEQMVREAELEEMKQEVEKAASLNLEEEFTKTVDPHGDVQRALSEPVLANPLADEPAIAAPTAEGPAEPVASGAEERAGETTTPSTPQPERPAAEEKADAAASSHSVAAG